MNKKTFLISAVVMAGTLNAGTSSDTEAVIEVDGNSVINTLSEHFFGHNYWMWCETWGNSVAGSESQVSSLQLKLLRFGGAAADLGNPDSVTPSVLAGFREYCETVGAEPLFQLQIARYRTAEERVAGAVRMLNEIRKTGAVTYVSIGNEPDIYPDNLAANEGYNVKYLSSYTLDEYCGDFNAIVPELRKIEPNLKIIGLELSNRYADWIPGFLDKCKDNVDMISVHYYPYGADQCTYSKACKYLSSIGSFYTDIRRLITDNADGRKIPLIIGETNFSWDGDPQKSTLNASPGTFNAGMWFADFVGVSSTQPDLFSIMPWSIREGWTLGFIDDAKKPRPVFHLYKEFSTNAKKYVVLNNSSIANVRTYGYRDDEGNLTVFALNWDTTAAKSVCFKFSGILDEASYTYELPAHSFSSLLFSASAPVSPEITVYTDRNPSGVHPIGIGRQLQTGSLPQRYAVSLNVDRSMLKVISPRTYENVKGTIMTLQGQVLHRFKVVTMGQGVTLVPVSLRIRIPDVLMVRLESGGKNIAVLKVKSGF